jgi:hypothetical protein
MTLLPPPLSSWDKHVPLYPAGAPFYNLIVFEPSGSSIKTLDLIILHFTITFLVEFDMLTPFE